MSTGQPRQAILDDGKGPDTVAGGPLSVVDSHTYPGHSVDHTYCTTSLHATWDIALGLMLKLLGHCLSCPC